jgi:hypothetical protein
MLWYDSQPSFHEGITKYEGSPRDKDDTTFRSFYAARDAAKQRITEEINDLKEEILLLDKLTPDTVPVVRNPFY